MLGVILMATNSSFQKGMLFCRSIYVKKVMKLHAFIFVQPSYLGRDVRKPVFGDLGTTQAQTSLRICAV